MISNDPIFILGNPRSGTTLLRLMLTSHPNIVVPPECGFAIWLFPQFSNFHVDIDGVDGIINFSDAVFCCRKFDTWGLSLSNLRSFLLETRPTNYAELVAGVYAAYAAYRRRNFTRWGDKNNFYLHHVNELRSIFPNARFLHIVRDVRDVACSYRRLASLQTESPYAPRLPVTIREITGQWAENIQVILRSLNPVQPHQKMTLRYEDLVRNGGRMLRRVCEWLGEDYAETMLEFHMRNMTLGLEPAQTLEWKLKTFMPLDESSVGQFRELLSNDEHAEILEVASDLLENFGYYKS